MNALEKLIDGGEQTLGYVGFSLMAKINGRIVSRAMSAVSRQGQELDAVTVAKLEGFTDDRDFLADEQEPPAGLSKAITPQLELAQWLGVRAMLADAKVEPHSIGDNLIYIMNRAGAQATAVDDEAEIAKVARQTGFSVEDVVAMFGKNRKRDYDRTVDRLKSAKMLIEDTLPDMDFTQSIDVESIDLDGVINPSELSLIVSSAIASGKKSAVRTSENTTEALASLVLLQAVDDTI